MTTDKTVQNKTKRDKGGSFVGFIMIGVGLIFLLDNFLPGFSIGRMWPLILIVVGSAILYQERK